MIVRATIIPDQTTIHLSVPENFVGRKLEAIIYPVDELNIEVSRRPAAKNPSEFAGTITKEEGKTFRKYLKWSRS